MKSAIWRCPPQTKILRGAPRKARSSAWGGKRDHQGQCAPHRGHEQKLESSWRKRSSRGTSITGSNVMRIRMPRSLKERPSTTCPALVGFHAPQRLAKARKERGFGGSPREAPRPALPLPLAGQCARNWKTLSRQCRRVAQSDTILTKDLPQEGSWPIQHRPHRPAGGSRCGGGDLYGVLLLMRPPHGEVAPSSRRHLRPDAGELRFFRCLRPPLRTAPPGEHDEGPPARSSKKRSRFVF